MSDIKCPFCSSRKLTSSRRGFSIIQAVAGELLFGPAGALAGAIDQDKITVKCENCGKSWEAGTIAPPPANRQHTPQRTPTDAELALLNELAESERKLRNLENQEQREILKVSNDLSFLEKQKKERKFKIAGRKFNEAAALAFSEITVTLSCARKKDKLDEIELLLAFEEIVGKELLDAFKSILAELEKSSHYEFLKQEAVRFAVTVNYPIYAGKDMSAATQKILAAAPENLILATFRFKCMKCGQKYEGDHTFFGCSIECTSCGEKITLVPFDFLNR